VTTKPRTPEAQLVHALGHFGIDRVIDIGAHSGQYARHLRAAGWAGPILSFEPQQGPHAALEEASRDDPMWEVAPPVALGERDGRAELLVSADTDMSSLLPQNATLGRISPSSRITGRQLVRMARLDTALAGRELGRLFLKLDVQGAEWRVLEGAPLTLERTVGLQLEMALVPLYEGERDWRATIDRLDSLGFALHLLIPGYYERKLARQLQVDGVFFRRPS
jgi:FkbM family methyltransferase